MKRAIISAVAVAFTCALALPAAWAGSTPKIEPVVPGPGQQFRPTVNEVGLAWSSYRNRHQNVYYKDFGGHRVKVNASGWSAGTGSLASAHTLVYQQYRTVRRPVSDIYSFNTKTHRRHKIKSAVNSAQWEYWPVASTRAILFGRCYLNRSNRCKRMALMLYDSQADRKPRTLIRDFGRREVVPGFAGSRYVAWTDCAKVRCHIGYYDMTKHRSHRLDIRGKDMFAPWIDEATDQMYFVQDGAAKCGDHTAIRVAPLGETTGTLISKLRPGWALTPRISVATRAGDHQDLYFTRGKCGSSSSSIYRLTDIP
jgi:hypothetical protein